MTELPLVIISICGLAITWSVVATAFELRFTLRRINEILPDAEEVIKEAKGTLAHMRRVMTRTDHVSKQIESVALKACATVSSVVEQVAAIKEQTEHSVSRWFGTNGNGSRLVSRSRRNSRKH